MAFFGLDGIGWRCSAAKQALKRNWAGLLKKSKAKSAIDEYVGSRMREGRLSRNISQEGLAKALGISFQQIQNYEKGVNGVSAVRLFEICKILNVSLSFMFQRDPKNEVNVGHSATARSVRHGEKAL